MARTALARLSLAAAGLLAGLAGAEWLVRAFGPDVTVVFRGSVQPSANAILAYELRPGGRDGTRRISSAGLRDAEVDRAKPPGTFRIALVGDSIAYGSGGRREQGLADQLEALLAARSKPDAPRAEVLNLGVPGYNATQGVERLRGLGLSFEPDLLVWAYALNDPQAFSIEAEALRAMRSESEPADPGPLARALARSRLVLLARQIASQRPARERPEQMPQDPAYEAAQRGRRGDYLRAIHREGSPGRRWRRALADFASIARERGLPAWVVIFPVFPDARDADPLADVCALVAEEARRQGLVALDLERLYAAARRALGRELSLDFFHPNALGHQIAAHALFAELCRAALPAPNALACEPPPGAAPLEVSIDRLVGTLRRGSRPPSQATSENESSALAR